MPRSRRPLRRTLSLTAILVAAALVGAACGDDDGGGTAATAEPATATAEPTPEAAEAVGEAEFPVTVEHKFGEITVEEMPERVVVVGYKDQDWLYQFGVSPILVRQWQDIYPNEINPWVADLVDGDPPETFEGEINFEQIAELQPDLIVGTYSGIEDSDYELLSGIAPTLAGPVGTVDFQEPWQDMTRLIGAALGQADRAEEIVGGVEQLYVQAQSDHPELDGATVIFAAAGLDGDSAIIRVRTSGDPRSKVLTDLGLVVPPEIDAMADADAFAFPLSPELWGETFDLADAVVVISDPEVREVIEANPTFEQSQVSAEDRVIWLDTDAISTTLSFTSPLSIPILLESLVPQLVAALDGDPATAVPPSPEL